MCGDFKGVNTKCRHINIKEKPMKEEITRQKNIEQIKMYIESMHDRVDLYLERIEEDEIIQDILLDAQSLFTYMKEMGR